MLKPLIVVPISGALGGIIYYKLDPLRCKGGWRKLSANVLSLFAYFFVLWLGTILGLDGTLWN